MEGRERVCFVADGVLTGAECAALIASSEERGFREASASYPPGYRDNARQVRDDAALAGSMLARLGPLLPARLGEGWRLAGLNSRFRLCRYRDGQQFTLHQDGAWHPSDQQRSWLTLMLYLNGPEDFTGGETRFYAEPGGPVWQRIEPRAGRLVVFDHDLWHDGAPVHHGQKYILRTDVLYARTGEPPLSGHRGYAWCAVRLRDGRLATGGRDRTVRLWQGGSPQEVLADRHTLSVLALAEDASGRLWSGSRDGTLCAGSDPARPAHDGAVLCLLAEPGVGGGVVSGGADGAVRRWPSGELVGRHRGWVRALATSSEGRLLSGGEDGVVMGWGEAAAEVLWSRPGAQVWSLAAGRDGEVYAGLSDGEIVALRAGRSWRGHGAGVRALQVDAQGRLWSGGEDCRVRLWSHGLSREWSVGGFVSALTLAAGGVVCAGYAGVEELHL